ncbi:hypothetical protein E4T66_10315 [Sinimarinibacterium sp. CAU 1509]|uniref:hypothetical protein n=1 Tax=Sinimarinibacterium sp. CAU 1509 TaxID=2562283 RepID=UPI0010AC787D|nr:hypothetical protein [Sinimarinibacterium sp. CAU 1509]TJY61022.1 hypothetical protein E4T66_10315 [Sinimarinibacterium sp. CAU 1509]
METKKIVAILLIAAGALSLGYGGFSYTRDTHRADMGPIHLSVAEKEYVSVPVWIGVGALLLGGILLLSRKSA